MKLLFFQIKDFALMVICYLKHHFRNLNLQKGIEIKPQKKQLLAHTSVEVEKYMAEKLCCGIPSRIIICIVILMCIVVIVAETPFRLHRDTVHSFRCCDSAAYLYSLEKFFLLIVCNGYLRNNLILSMRHGIKLEK